MSDTRLTILVLEDDLLLAMDMQDYLEEKGYDVVGPLATVSAGVEAASTVDLDGAIVDLNLNGHLSLPVIETLKQRGIPVIVCSGYAELPEMRMRLAGLPLVPKLWSPDMLSNTIMETIGVEADLIGVVPAARPQPAETSSRRSGPRW